MSVVISVAVCTHNRARHLRLALESLAKQTLSRDCWEVLVIDNASTDQTRRVVEEFRGTLPRVRYHFEPTVGVSSARNAGWRGARGEFVAYLDDDAIAEASWLERILGFLTSVEPTPGAVGGRVDPIWEGPRPVWLSDTTAAALSLVHWSNSPIALRPDQWIVAANVAFPRRVVEEAGGFRLDLGRRGRILLSNEENLLRLQIERLGYTCYYHPEIRVRHHVHASRLTRAWFLRRSRWQGISDARLEAHAQPRRPRERFRIGCRTLAGVLFSPRTIGALLIPTRHPERFRRQSDAWYRLGYGTGQLGTVGRRIHGA
jgi:glycosyltransferase involved in cell wall biosynthesis